MMRNQILKGMDSNPGSKNEASQGPIHPGCLVPFTMEKIMNRLFSDKDLRRLIVPLIFEQMLAMMVGMADTMMIATRGEAAVSGVSLVDMINYLIFSILAALAQGGAVVTSQFIGARKIKEALKSSRQLLFTVLMSGLFICFIFIMFRRGILKILFGKIEDDVMANAIIYLIISASAYPFIAIYNSCAAVFRSMGNSKITFRVSAVINVFNIIGNAFCIFVLNMGVAGVALPTLAAWILGSLMLYILLKNPNRQLYFESTRFTLDLGHIKKILRIGIPGGIESGLFQLGRVLVVSIISGFGTVQIAANGVANNLDALGSMIGCAMNLAVITVIGQCVGAGDEEQVKYYTKKLLRFTYITEGAVIAVVMVLLDRILSIYGLNAETTALAKKLVLIHNGCAFFMWPLAFVLPNILRAANDVVFTMIVSICSMFFFRVFFGHVLGNLLGMGAVGVWIAMISDWVCRISFFVARFAGGRWKKLAGL